MTRKPKVTPQKGWKSRSLLAGGDGAVTSQPTVDVVELLAATEQLFVRFKIPAGNWPLLAATLALKGGFIQVELPTGQVPRWNDALLAALWLEAGAWCREHGQSARATFSDAGFMQRWADCAGEAETSPTLKRRYTQAQKSTLVRGLSAAANACPDIFWRDARGMAKGMFQAAAGAVDDETVRRASGAKLSK